MPATESHQKNSNIIYTRMQSANIRTFGKAMSFNVNLSKLLLEDSRCIPSGFAGKVDNAILLHHHPTTLLFQFGPLLIILILLLERNNDFIILMKYNQITSATTMHDIT